MKTQVGSGCNPPFFISFSAKKNVIIAYIARNSRDLVWGHNLDLGTCKKFKSFGDRHNIHASKR